MAQGIFFWVFLGIMGTMGNTHYTHFTHYTHLHFAPWGVSPQAKRLLSNNSLIASAYTSIKKYFYAFSWLLRKIITFALGKITVEGFGLIATTIKNC